MIDNAMSMVDLTTQCGQKRYRGRPSAVEALVNAHRRVCPICPKVMGLPEPTEPARDICNVMQVGARTRARTTRMEPPINHELALAPIRATAGQTATHRPPPH